MSDDPDTADWSRTRTTVLILGLCLLSTAAAAYEIAPASVAPLIRASLGIGATRAGWLVSVMYATAVIASVPVGVILDRVDVRWAVAAAGIALLIAGVTGWYTATRGAFLALLASRVLGGLAYVVVWNAGANLISQAVDTDVRATAMGVFTASAPIGFALGQFGSPLIAEAVGWPAVLPAFATIASLGLVTFLATTAGHSLGIETAVPDRESVVDVFTDREVWTLCALAFLGFSLYLFLNSWMPSYLTQELDVPLALAGSLTALFPAVGVVSRTTGGLLSDRAFGGRRRPVALLSFVLATPAVVGFVFATRVSAVVGLLVTAGFGIQLGLGLLFTYVTELVPSDVAATSVSMMTSVGLFGAFLAPIVAGELIARAGYRPAFLLAGVVGAAGVALAWRVPEANP